jgi:4-hydroxy-2-oxoheptanedioate aldolase
MSGDRTINAWLSTPSPHTAEVFAKAGFDAVTIDIQHGLHDYASAVDCMRAIALHGARPLARVPWNEPGIVMKLLDAGAEGIICPMISTPEEAASFVGACRYPFDGGYRSFGPMRGLLMHDDYVKNSKSIVKTWAMIETKEGFERLDEIAATDTLDGFYIGPADLSLAFGMAPGQDKRDTAFLEMADRIRDSAHNAGMSVGIHTGSAEYAKEMLDRGFDLVTAASDNVILNKGAADIMRFLAKG